MKKQKIKSKVNPLTIQKLLFAGRASLTFRNQETGEHMTIKMKQLIEKDKDGRRRLKRPYFFLEISLLNDGVQDKRFAATVRNPETRLQYKLAQGLSEDSRLAKAVRFVMNAYQRPEMLREKNVALFHEGICCKCGLPLTHPQSIDRGLGDDCYDYLHGIKKDPNPTSPI